MESYFEKFTIMISHSQNGPSGPVVTWTDGQSFDGLYIVDTSAQIRIAEAQGIKVLGRFVTSPDIPLIINNYIRRARDSTYFRLKSEPKQSPKQAESQLKYFDAEIVASLPR